MRDRPITIASPAGRAPPDKDVPAPRATTFTRFSLQNLRMRLTSVVVRGKTAARGAQR